MYWNAYDRAVARRINQNRAKGAAKRRVEWMTPEREQLVKDLNAYGMRDGRTDGFMCNMLQAIEQWGCLTEKQEAAAIKAIERAKQRDAERQAKREEFARNNAESQFVGELGQRNVWCGQVMRSIKLSGDFGDFTLCILRDVHGNVFVFRDNKCHEFEVGQDVTFKGTVRKHSERDGVKQTVFNRVVIQ
jgi:hypothetical protein